MTAPQPPVRQPSAPQPPAPGVFGPEVFGPVPADPAELPVGPRFTTGPDRWRAPVARHRHSGPWAVALLGGLVLLAVVVAVGGAVTGGELDNDQRFREFVVTGEPGEPVTARTFQVTVLGVRTATRLTEPPGGGRVYETSGVWVLVRVQAEALREPVVLGYAAVRDAQGRTRLASGRFDQPLVDRGHTLQPGIPVAAEVAFEVPADTATDLTIRLGTNGFDLRLETVAEVPLPIEQSRVPAGPAATEPVQLATEPELVVGDPPVPGQAGGTGP